VRKAVGIPVILALCFISSSCIDIFQHLTKDTNGIDRNTIRVTVSKAVIEMANNFSGSGAVDYEKFFDENNMDEMDINGYNQFGASIRKINDSTDIGYLVEISLNYKDKDIINITNQSNVSFIQKYNGKNIILPLDLGSYGSLDDNAMVAAFLSTGKYRLAVNKKCISNIRKVTIKVKSKETEIGFLDLYDEYLIEVPLPVIMASAVELRIYSK
jgi:hypothetical protein